jgi:hypothetical protein
MPPGKQLPLPETVRETLLAITIVVVFAFPLLALALTWTSGVGDMLPLGGCHRS